MSDREMPAPTMGAESEPFWDAAADKRFLFKRCGGCGRSFWYPRALCPYCFSDDTRWTEAPKTGVIYSFSVMRRAKVPYILAYVTLDEGPTLMTNVVGVDPNDVAIGQRVEVTFATAADGSLVPVFAPVGEGRSS